VPNSPFSDANRPAREAAPPGLSSIIGSAAADQQAGDEADAGGDADRTPGVVMHVVVGGAGDLLGLVHHGGLGFGQLDLGAGEAVLVPGADFGDFFAGLAGGGAQQFFGCRRSPA
jgi:hypothetical protein